MALRKGDRVSLMATVDWDQRDNNNIGVHVDGHHSSIYLPISEIVLVQPRFEVGDEVEFKDHGTHAAIVAIDGAFAWVRRLNAPPGFISDVVAPLSDLKRVDLGIDTSLTPVSAE